MCHFQEFVYREKDLTHLLDISERLKNFYSSKFGAPVTIFPDSRSIDRATLDLSKAYLQITHLEPFLHPDEILTRRSLFRKSTNLSKAACGL